MKHSEQASGLSVLKMTNLKLTKESPGGWGSARQGSDQPPPFVRVRQNLGTGGSQTNLRRVPEFVESRTLAEHAVLSCPTPTRGLIHRPTDGGLRC